MTPADLGIASAILDDMNRRTFHCSLEHNEREGMFAFVDVAECTDTGDCIDYLKKEWPNHHLISIEDTTDER